MLWKKIELTEILITASLYASLISFLNSADEKSQSIFSGVTLKLFLKIAFNFPLSS